MAYCTQSQLEERYGTWFLIQLSDRGDAPATEIDAAMVTRAIAEADSLIDGYLKPVYALPLSTTPDLVRDLSQRIAIYYAHANVASDKINRDHELALRQLRDISTGMIKLDVAGVEPEGSGASEVQTNDRIGEMNSDNMKGFI